MDPIDCPAASICWRLSYTRYFRAVGYAVPPPRDTVFWAGFATAAMLPRGGIFAEQIPLPDAQEGECPALRGLGYIDCREYAKWLQKADAARRRQERFAAKRPRTTLGVDVRRAVAARAGYRCAYCGIAQGAYREGHRVRCVVDHFVPLALGGADTESNLVFSCKTCNNEKGTNLWEIGCKMMQK